MAAVLHGSLAPMVKRGDIVGTYWQGSALCSASPLPQPNQGSKR